VNGNHGILSLQGAIQEAGRCLLCYDAPCNTGCGADTNPATFILKLRLGDIRGAVRTLRENNVLAAACAQVCPTCRLCVEGCARSGIDEPIRIAELQAFLADYERRAGMQVLQAPAPGDRQIAVIGSGPAGLAAAHYLSLAGYKPTVFEADDRPGGMLVSGIPAFRLPREVLGKEIDALLADGVSLRCNTALGRDFTVDSLFEDGFKAVFLATGAHKSRRLGLEGENCKGVISSIHFLKAFNLQREQLARGRVAVIGGGNSAVDAARVAVRQDAVESVTILYRRTRDEMPAFEEEVEAALVEGIDLQILVSPVGLRTEGGGVTGVTIIRNRLGDRGADGRRKPVPIPGTEIDLPFETVIVAISEEPDAASVADASLQPLETGANGTVRSDPATLTTSQAGVFAGGDLVTGPNTVVDAIAAGKKAALMIDRWLRGQELEQPAVIRLPNIYVEPALLSEEELEQADRVQVPVIHAASREQSFREVELSLSVEDATREARRCLRCDLEFTQRKENDAARPATVGETA